MFCSWDHNAPCLGLLYKGRLQVVVVQFCLTPPGSGPVGSLRKANGAAPMTRRTKWRSELRGIAPADAKHRFSIRRAKTDPLLRKPCGSAFAVERRAQKADPVRQAQQRLCRWGGSRRSGSLEQRLDGWKGVVKVDPWPRCSPFSPPLASIGFRLLCSQPVLGCGDGVAEASGRNQPAGLIHMAGEQLIPGCPGSFISSSGKAFTGGWQICRLAANAFLLSSRFPSDSSFLVDYG